MNWLGLAASAALVLLPVAVGCGRRDDAIQATVDAKVSTAIAGIPAATPQPTASPVVLPPTPTALPTATPQPTATPAPTATPQPATSVSGAGDLNAVYLNTLRSVFYIELPGGHGSGWLLEPGLIVTVAHVVGANKSAVVRQSSGPSFEADVVATDSLRDITLLSYDTGTVVFPFGARALPLVSENSVSGNAKPVLVMGYAEAGVKPDGSVGGAGVKVGVQSQIVDFGESSVGVNLVIDAAEDPGDSGGPVLDSTGNVVGMARAVVTSTGSGQRVVGVFYAVASQEISASLPMLKAGKSR